MNVWLTGLVDRALRTALQVLAAYLTAAKLISNIDWTEALSATALAVLLSIITSVLGSPSFGEAWYFQLAERAVKTFLQTLGAFFGTTLLIEDVPWATAFSASLVAALYSLVTSTLTTRPGDERAVGQVDLISPRA